MRSFAGPLSIALSVCLLSCGDDDGPATPSADMGPDARRGDAAIDARVPDDADRDAGPDGRDVGVDDAGDAMADVDAGPRPDAGPSSGIATQVVIRPTYAEPPFILDRPATIDGWLYFPDVSSASLSGAIAFDGPGGVFLGALTATLDGDTLSIAAGDAAVRGLGRLEWSSFEMQLVDSDGNGALDTGDGTLSGRWRGFAGDVIDESDVTAAVIAMRDSTAGTVVLVPAASSRPPGSDLAPDDSVTVRFSEPVVAADVPGRLDLLLDGAASPGVLSAGDTAVAGLIHELTLTEMPDLLPFGSTFTLEIGGLTDVAANAMVWDGERLSIAADPGSALDNASFEMGLALWSPMRNVTAAGTFHGVAPADGSMQAVIREESSLVGYFEIPVGATELSVSATLFSEIGELDADRSAVIALEAGGGDRRVVYDAYDHRMESAVWCEPSCEDELRHRIPTVRATIDVTDLAGRRVVLSASARSAFFIGVNYYALVIDDIVVR